MLHSDFAKFYDSATGLTCNFVPVDGTTDDLVEPVRDMFIDSMNGFGYVGFSREIDNIFHMRSTYLYLTDDAANVIMTCRVTPRSPGTILPFEMGIKDSGGSYRLGDAEPVIDVNTYTYVRGYYERAMPLLAAGLGYYSKICNAKTAYCLYDVVNEKIKRAYMSIGFALTDRFPEPIHFPTFCRKREGRLEPVRWRIMQWDYKTIERQARIAVERYELLSDA